METFLNTLFNLIEIELYEPILNTFNNNNFIIKFCDFINNLFVALFGHESIITVDNIASLIAIIFLISVIVLLIKTFLNLFNFIENLLNEATEIRSGKKKRR